MNANFDLCDRISTSTEPPVIMVRATVCSAKFSGSGGAIIGTYDDKSQFSHLHRSLRLHRLHKLKPRIA